MNKLLSILFALFILGPHCVTAQSPNQQVDSLLKHGLSSERKKFRTTNVRSHSENALERVTTQPEGDFSHPGYPQGNISMRQKVTKERRLIEQHEYLAKEDCRNSGQKLKQRKKCIKRVNRKFNRKKAQLDSDPEQYFY